MFRHEHQLWSRCLQFVYWYLNVSELIPELNAGTHANWYSCELSRTLLLIHFYFFPTAPIRLVNGANKCQGRVELLHSGRWGTVCDDDWSLTNAEVVCRQLGCGRAVEATTNAHFGAGSGPIWLDNVVCNGDEPNLPRCQNQGFEVHNCGHNEDAGVVCEGKIQYILTQYVPSLGYSHGHLLCHSDRHLLVWTL